MPAFDLYVETHSVDEWRDGCVYRTTSLGYEWVPEAVVKANRPAETGIIYAAASTEVAMRQQTIRVSR